MKVILDTDIGSDIDDAVCLAYLLKQPACELMGITTVSGASTQRAMLASALCKAAGKAVPIYPGVELPFLIEQRQPECPQAAALGRWEHDTDFPQGEAIEFLRRTIRQHPGEITLLAIGPMTNVGLLFAVDPEIPGLLKGLMMMAGIFNDPQGKYYDREWNAICDPHAIAKIYQTPVAVHRSVGIDVTMQVTMDAAQVRERFQHDVLRPVLDFAEVWFHGSDTLVFHDPLAAAVLFDDEICSFQRGTVEIELTNPDMLGKTHWQAGEGAHEVAVTVDSARFFDHYFAVVTG